MLISDPATRPEQVLNLLKDVSIHARKAYRPVEHGLPSMLEAMVAYVDAAREKAVELIPLSEVVPVLTFLPAVAYLEDPQLPDRMVYRRAIIQRDLNWQEHIHRIRCKERGEIEPMRFDEIGHQYPRIRLDPVIVPSVFKHPTRASIEMVLERYHPDRCFRLWYGGHVTLRVTREVEVIEHSTPRHSKKHHAFRCHFLVVPRGLCRPDITYTVQTQEAAECPRVALANRPMKGLLTLPSLFDGAPMHSNAILAGLALEQQGVLTKREAELWKLVRAYYYCSPSVLERLERRAARIGGGPGGLLDEKAVDEGTQKIARRLKRKARSSDFTFFKRQNSLPFYLQKALPELFHNAEDCELLADDMSAFADPRSPKFWNT